MRPGCIFDSGDGLKYAEDYTGCPDTANIVVGAIVKIPPSEEATTTEEQEGIGRYIFDQQSISLFTHYRILT